MPKYSENLNLRLDDPVADVSQLSRNWFEANFGYTDSNMTKIDSAYKAMKDDIADTPTKSGVGATGDWNINITGSANSAVHDGVGNDISSSYITGISVGNTSITYTKGDGTNQEETIKTDETLSIKGMAADAKATGDMIKKSIYPTLVVNVTAGSSVTVTKDSYSFSGTTDDKGEVEFNLPALGRWDISASHNGRTVTDFIDIDVLAKKYTITLSYTKIFGVVWAYSNSSTALARITKANDPNNYVNTDITTSPSPAVGIGSGSSQFDDYMPWKGMDEYNIVNNTIGAKRGESGFSRSSNDVMVYIPEFYYKVINDSSSSKRYFYIADKATTGFEKHPGSGRYVGRYNTSIDNHSCTGLSPYTNMTRGTARSGAKGKGDKWALYDYASWCAVWLLYIVEYADWDSQSKIGRGWVDGNSNPITSGGTDSMTYHTGRVFGSDGKTAVQYRHIENPWGNINEWIDGVNFVNDATYICTDISKYADDTVANYTNIGNMVQHNGYISAIGYNPTSSWGFSPTSTTGGSETTYIPDFVKANTGLNILCVGGSWTDFSAAGLFCWITYGSTLSNQDIGARLLFVP